MPMKIPMLPILKNIDSNLLGRNNQLPSIVTQKCFLIRINNVYAWNEDDRAL